MDPKCSEQASLGSLPPLRHKKNLVRFEADLFGYLSRFTAALEAEADLLSTKLSELERTLWRGEKSMSLLEARLQEMHAAEQVWTLPLDVSQVSRRHIAASNSERARSEPDWHNNCREGVESGKLSSASWNQELHLLPAEDLAGGPSAGNLAAIALGLQGLKKIQSQATRHLILPPLLGGIKGAPGGSTPGSGKASSFGKESANNEAEASGASLTAPVSPGGELPHTTMDGGEEDAHLWNIRPQEFVGPRKSVAWAPEEAIGHQTGSVVRASETNVGEGRDCSPGWSEDPLEPSASAVRGFRALLEAALNAPGAFGDDDAWAQRDEAKARNAADERHPSEARPDSSHLGDTWEEEFAAQFGQLDAPEGGEGNGSKDTGE